MDHTRSEQVKKVTVDGVVLEIDGYYDHDTPSGKYEWYDVFHRGTCLNLGDPFYKMPTQPQLKSIAKQVKKEYAQGLWKPLTKKKTKGGK